MATSEAHIPTDLAPRYLGQLCKHFEHKRPVEYSRDHGQITFDTGVCTLDATGTTLILHADAPDPENLDRLQNVVVRHLERFAFRNPIEVTWTPKD
jgi:hypothetical protein